MSITLNQSQEDAIDAMLIFLIDPNQKYFILSGGPGYGKSTLIRSIKTTLFERYKVLSGVTGRDPWSGGIVFTATTNSAADSISTEGVPCQTIHKLLGLTVVDKKLVKRSNNCLKNNIVVIDEYTLIDPALFRFLDESCSKVILVGDRDQLLAVKGMAQAIRDREPDFILTEPMRTKNPDILNVTNTLRDWVHYGDSELDIEGMKNVSWISRDDFLDVVHDTKNDFSKSRIISHTNNCSIFWNQEIRKSRGLPKHFIVGEPVINNTFMMYSRKFTFPTDSEYTITDVNFDMDNIPFYSIADNTGFEIGSVYALNNHHPGANTIILDIRSQYASTIYKAQGRTFDTVYIDLESFPPSTSRSVLTRSLYVGASRAKEKVVFVGELHPTLLGKL